MDKKNYWRVFILWQVTYILHFFTLHGKPLGCLPYYTTSLAPTANQALSENTLNIERLNYQIWHHTMVDTWGKQFYPWLPEWDLIWKITKFEYLFFAWLHQKFLSVRFSVGAISKQFYGAAAAGLKSLCGVEKNVTFLPISFFGSVRCSRSGNLRPSRS